MRILCAPLLLIEEGVADRLSVAICESAAKDPARIGAGSFASDYSALRFSGCKNYSSP